MGVFLRPTLFFPICTAIDGGVGDFGPWSQCSKSCGGGRKSRERACVDPIPNDPGKGCGNLTQVEECNTQECPSKYKT